MWSHTCHAFRWYATKIIWKDLYINGPGKIVSLLQVGDTWQTAADYGSHVLNLYIDTRLISNIMAAPGHEYLEEATPSLLALLPNLINLTFEGPLYHDQFTNILQVHGLKRLNIRGDDQNLRLGSPDWMEFYTNLILNFLALASLGSLQSLKIGRLMAIEAYGLAYALPKLPLVNLEVSSSIWVRRADPRYHILGSEQGISPIVSLVAMLAPILRKMSDHLDPKTAALQHGFPPTLKTLVLADRYHDMRTSIVLASNEYMMPKLLEGATEACEGLQKLEISFRSNPDGCLFMEVPVCSHGRSNKWCAYALGNWKGQWELDLCKDTVDKGEWENPFAEPAIDESRRALKLWGSRTFRFTRIEGDQPLYPIIQKREKLEASNAGGLTR